MQPLEKNTVALGASIRKKPLDVLIITDPISSIRRVAHTAMAPSGKSKRQRQDQELPNAHGAGTTLAVLHFASGFARREYNRGVGREQGDGPQSRYRS